jgi:hypothetical protein
VLRSMLGLISSLRATVALQAALRWTARSGATRTVGTRARAAARGVPNGAAIAADVPCRLSTRVIEGRRPASRSWIHPGTGAHGDHHVSALPHHRPPPRAVPAAPPRRSGPAASPSPPPPPPPLSKLPPSFPACPQLSRSHAPGGRRYGGRADVHRHACHRARSCRADRADPNHGHRSRRC